MCSRLLLQRCRKERANMAGILISQMLLPPNVSFSWSLTALTLLKGTRTDQTVEVFKAAVKLWLSELRGLVFKIS